MSDKTPISKKEILDKEDFILYILNKLEPDRSDKIRLNKVAFFAEFAYLLRFKKNLSSIDYAAIDMGPVIDNYDAILKKMQEKKLVAIDGYKIRPLKSPSVDIAPEVRSFLDNVIEKYAKLNKTELIGLSHLTDSYKITTNNEKVMGKMIDKKLAFLETFLLDDEENGSFFEDELPSINRSDLIKYVR